MRERHKETGKVIELDNLTDYVFRNRNQKGEEGLYTQFMEQLKDVFPRMLIQSKKKGLNPFQMHYDGICVRDSGYDSVCKTFYIKIDTRSEIDGTRMQFYIHFKPDNVERILEEWLPSFKELQEKEAEK